MKTVNTSIEICDCGCGYCEYNELNVQFCVDCPYCDECESWDLEVGDGDRQKIQCSYCNKSFRCKILFDHI